jgi:hypothetical protein
VDRFLTYNDVQALYFAVGRPQLSFAHSGNALTLSWPVGATGFHLQNSDALGSGAIWSNVSVTPVVSADGATQSVTDNAGAQSRYYRLQR